MMDTAFVQIEAKVSATPKQACNRRILILHDDAA